VLAWFDHAFFLTLVVLFPLRAAFSGIRRLRRASPEELPRVRLAVYREAIAIQWGLVVTLVALWLATGRAWSGIGAVPRPSAGLAVVSALVLLAVVIMIRQRRLALRDDEALAGVRAQMAHLEVMLPHDRRELGWFYRLSLTAGICEELLYRGYIIWYLGAWLPPVGAALAASVIFGFGHAYQGRRGVITTGIFGGVLAAVYLVSGSLLLPIVMHALIDAHSGHLAFHAFERGAALDRERAAADRARRAAEEAERAISDAAAETARRARDAAAAAQDGPAAVIAPAESPVTSGPGIAAGQSHAHDVIVAGLGALGSAVAYHLAARGTRVLGLDRWQPPHDRGSSHGETRLIREAYFEAPFYVPIVQRSYDLWSALELEAGEPLMRLTGGLMIGPPDAALVMGAEKSATAYALPHERLSAADVRARYPGLEPEDHTVAIWEPRTGMLFPEACIAAHLAGAAARGAALRYGETVTGWHADGDGVVVETTSGRHRAGQLVLASGAWMPALLGGAGVPLRISRQTLHWFEPASEPERFDPGRCPAWIYEHAPGIFTYGFPRLHGTVKAAMHVPGETVDPDAIERDVSADEAAALVGALRQYAPGVAGRRVRSAVCMYTNTPDGHFTLDRHPAHSSVLIVSACSGHGFKFASALGEACADLLGGGAPRFDFTPFAIARFQSGAPLTPVR
jgi:sarcosine oxidase